MVLNICDTMKVRSAHSNVFWFNIKAAAYIKPEEYK